MSIIWNNKAPAHKKGGPSSPVTPQKYLVGGSETSNQSVSSGIDLFLQAFSVNMSGHTWKTFEIHRCCHLHPSIVLLLYDRGLPGHLASNKTVCYHGDREPVVAQTVFGGQLSPRPDK